MTNYYKEPVTDFEKVRSFILFCAYMRGAWEEPEFTVRQYKKIQDQQIELYTCIIKECYEVIAILKLEGHI